MNARAHLPHTDDAPRDLRTEGGGGKIYPVDPAAWEHFKAVMARQQDQPRRCQPKPAGIKRGRNGRLDADLQRKVDELRERARQKAAPLNQEYDMKKRSDFSDDDIIAMHRRYVTDQPSAEDIAADVGVSSRSILNWFHGLNLPVRQRGRPWTPEEIARINEIHHIDMPGAVPARPPEAEAPKPNPLAATVVWRAGAPFPAVPNGEQKPAPAPAVTAVDDDPLDIGEQLALLSDLLANANAQSVKLTGRISIQLQAEVVF